MKTLVVTTGVPEWIMDTLLSSLYKVGYTGDVLVVSYGDFTVEQKAHIKYAFKDKVKVVEQRRVYAAYTADRFRAYDIVLKDIYQNYDVIMSVDGNDIEFLKPIDELLEMAKTEICAVHNGETCEVAPKFHWITWKKLPPEYWEAIKTNYGYCMGMTVGPADQMYFVFKALARYLEGEGNNVFGSDLLMFNAFVWYEGLHVKAVDPKWNTSLNFVLEGRNGYTQKNLEDSCILHTASTTPAVLARNPHKKLDLTIAENWKVNTEDKPEEKPKPKTWNPIRPNKSKPLFPKRP